MATKPQLVEPSWQENFRHWTMRVNFQLALTRAQLEMLCSVSEDCWWNRAVFRGRAAPDNFIAATGALMRRGLIEWKPSRKPWDGKDLYSIRNCYQLTDAGWLVCELLKVTGLFQTPDLAIERKAKERRKR